MSTKYTMYLSDESHAINTKDIPYDTHAVYDNAVATYELNKGWSKNRVVAQCCIGPGSRGCKLFQ